MPTTSYAISGASGLIGGELANELSTTGKRVVRLIRPGSKHGTTPGTDEVEWSPQVGILDPAPLEGVDAFVHLAGENIAAGRWTAARKRRLVDSRVEATIKLIQSFSRLDQPPKAFLCASAVGYYGSSRTTPASENAPAGDDFLARLCVSWERAAATAADFGCRVVHLRFGVVLASSGGALKKLLPAFRLGLGGQLGNGQQRFSWISLDDAVRATIELLDRSDLAGAFNLCAPNPVTNREFTKELGRHLRRPTVLPLPSRALETLFGEMARGTLLASNYAIPTALAAAGFDFRYPDLPTCLAAALKS